MSTTEKKFTVDCDACGLPPRIHPETGKKLPLLRCSRCHMTYYHDIDCQRKHYKLHRNECRKHMQNKNKTAKTSSSVASQNVNANKPSSLQVSKNSSRGSANVLRSPFQCYNVKDGQVLQVATSSQSFQTIHKSSISFPIGTLCKVENDHSLTDPFCVRLLLDKKVVKKQQPVFESKDDDTEPSSGNESSSSNNGILSTTLTSFWPLEYPTPDKIDKYNLSRWKQSCDVWMEGVRLWYNEQAYLEAMGIWEKALGEETFQWISDDIEENDGHSKGCSLPPPLSGDAATRIILGRRLLFLGNCLLDAEQWVKGRTYVKRAIRTFPKDQSELLSVAFVELMLSYEEEQNMFMARTVAQWAMDHRCTVWKDVYQRPGFMSKCLDNNDKGDDNKVNNTEILPFFPPSKLPKWCFVLEQNWKSILNEFSALKDNLPFQHWPQVGSGDRGSGYDDHKVVSGQNGDWREWVLFGTGSENYDSSAPKTKAMLRRHVPEAISLAEAGGGEVIFSVLAPYTKIQPHCGSTNLRLTAHLGLAVPPSSTGVKNRGITRENNGTTCASSSSSTTTPRSPPSCGIRVRDTWHTWEEGKMLVFDDSYEHEVVNNTNTCRVVLLIRFWHPAVPKSKRNQILAEAIQHKEKDVRRRYNPPLPLPQFNAAESRGMKYSMCSKCMQSGYTSIKLVGTGNPKKNISFNCYCGEPIVG